MSYISIYLTIIASIATLIGLTIKIGFMLTKKYPSKIKSISISIIVFNVIIICGGSTLCYLLPNPEREITQKPGDALKIKKITIFFDKKEVNWSYIKSEYEKFTKNSVKIDISESDDESVDIYMEDPASLRDNITKKSRIAIENFKIKNLTERIKNIFPGEDGSGDIIKGQNKIYGIPSSIEAFGMVIGKSNNLNKLQNIFFYTEEGNKMTYLYANAFLSLANTPIRNKTRLDEQKIFQLIDFLENKKENSIKLKEILDNNSDNNDYNSLRKGYSVFAGTWHWKYLKKVDIKNVSFMPVLFDEGNDKISAGVTKYLSFGKHIQTDKSQQEAIIDFLNWFLGENNKKFFIENNIFCPTINWGYRDWKENLLIQSMLNDYILKEKTRPLYYLKDNEWLPDSSDNLSRAMDDFICNKDNIAEIKKRVKNIIDCINK